MTKMDAADLRREHDKAVTAANRKLHDAGALVDVTVTVGDVAFPCHKSLLAAWSGFFRSMFSSDFTESRSSHVTLAETSLLSSETFEALHTWMYRGELNLTADSAELILASAFYLQMNKTVYMLTDYIKRQYSGKVPVTRMFRHLNLAHSCGIPHLRDVVLEGMARNFDELVEIEELLQLNPQNILRLLAMDQLNAESEDVVFNAAFAWLHHSEDRLDYLRDVLKSLRVGLVGVGTIRKALDVKIMSKDSECCNILLDCLAAGTPDEETLQRLTKDFHEWFIKRTPAQREHGGSSDGHKRLLQGQDKCTLYGDIWRDAYANLGDSGPDMGDVTVTVDGDDFRCHKAVLFGWSEYFAKRFLVDEGSTVSDDWLPGEISSTHREDDLQASDRPSPSMESSSRCLTTASQASVESALKSPSVETPHEYQDTLNATSCGNEDIAVSDHAESQDGDGNPFDSLSQLPDPACGRSRESPSHISLTGDCMTRSLFRNLLDWIYRGQLQVTADNLCDVMKCARCLQMDGVVEIVKKYFHSYWPNLVGGEIMTMLHAARKCDLPDVYETCFTQIVAKFEKFWVSPEFKELLDIKTFLSLLQDDRLNVTSEDVVMQAALSWLRHSDSRLGHVRDVIKSVRLGLVRTTILIDGLDLAFRCPDPEVHAIWQQAAARDWRGDSFRKDHPAMYRPRLDNWTPRREENNPKTIDQIHREAEQESPKKQMMLSKMQHDTRRSRGLGIASYSRGSPPGDHGWQPVVKAKREIIDPTKRKFSSKGSVVEDVQLGSAGRGSFSGWGRGSFSGLGRGSFSSWGGGSSGGGGGGGAGGKTSSSGGPNRNIVAGGPGRTAGSRNQSRERTALSRDSSRGREDGGRQELPQAVMEKKTFQLVDEYLQIDDLEEAVMCVRELESPSNIHMLVTCAVTHVLERSAKARKMTAELIAELVKRKLLTVDQYIQGFSELLLYAEDMEIDIPQLWTYLGELVAPMVQHGKVPLTILKELCQPLYAANKAGVLVAQVLHAASHHTGHKEVGEMWRASGLRWSDFMASKQVRDFITKHKLEFTEGAEDPAPVERPVLSMERIQDELERLICRQKANNEVVFDWIEGNVGAKRTKEPAFIRALMTSVCASAISEHDGNYNVLGPMIQERGVLFQKYLDHKADRELQALYAIQALVHKLQHPPGVLRTFFDALYDEDYISEDAFSQWDASTDPTEQAGRGVARAAVVEFFTWLRDAEEESQDDN